MYYGKIFSWTYALFCGFLGVFVEMCTWLVIYTTINSYKHAIWFSTTSIIKWIFNLNFNLKKKHIKKKYYLIF